MNPLTYQKQSAVQQLMNTGYAHAAQAFSALINRKVSCQTVHLDISTTDSLAPDTRDTTLLLTDILGEANGRSYLILSEPERLAIQAACLPPMSDIKQRTHLGEALLKEIDNILSAAVITKLSEALGLHIYGGVPRLLTLPPESLRKNLQEDFSADEGDTLTVNARFVFKGNLDLQPRFLWKLSSDFWQHGEHYTPSSS